MRIFATILFTCTLSLLLFVQNAHSQSDNQGSAYQDEKVKGDSFAFLGNYPNPVRDYSYFKFRIANQQAVNIELYDLLGNKKLSTTKEFYKQGTHIVKMDVSSLKAGVYFYKVQVKNETITKRLNIVDQ